MPDELSEKDLASLLLLNHDEIDYGALSEKSLAWLASGGELYIATLALVALSKRNAGLAASTAESLLSSGPSDRHLNSTALSVLAKHRPSRAAEIALALGAQCEPLVLNRMMALLMSEAPLDPAVRGRLSENVERCLAADPPNKDDLDEFLVGEFLRKPSS